MILCQISDLHIKPEGVLANGGRVDTALALAACLEHILALPQRPDAILASGDLVDAGDPKEYANLVHLLGRLEREPGAPPVYLMPGNHDERSALRDAFPEHRWLRDGGAFIQYAVDLGPLRLVALDTVSPGEEHGELCDERLAWLDATLAAAPSRSTIVALHHHPFTSGLGYMDNIGLRNPAALESVIRRHRQVQRIVCGHLHRSMHLQWAGVPLSCCPSPAHQLLLDLRSGAEPAFTLEPPALLLHVWHPVHGIVTHQSAIGDYVVHYFRDSPAGA